MTPVDPTLVEIIRNIHLMAFDFDGVFTDNMVYVLQDGSEAIRCSRSGGLGLRKLEQLGIEVTIISSETNPVVTARSHKLKIRCIQGCEDKRIALQDLAGLMGIPLEYVAFMGNDINDLPCLTCVGFPIVVQDAHPDVIPYARYRTRSLGGRGAVREICDLFEQIRHPKGNMP